MQSANLSSSLKGYCLHYAFGSTHVSGLAGSFDFNYPQKVRVIAIKKMCLIASRKMLQGLRIRFP